MAGFEGTCWAGKQFRFLLKSDSFELLESDSKVYAVSRSIHYGLFLAFEGIRFFCKKNSRGHCEIVFLNLLKNMERLRRTMSFNLSHKQQNLVPSIARMEEVFLEYFRSPEMRDFLKEMCEIKAQGYFRPFTVDEDQSIGVTFPANPAIRGIACRYDKYLGEPFTGVVIPQIVRAVGINGTGCLKLGSNYVISIKAVDAADQICPGAGSALLLDDRPDLPAEKRNITEWDTSCCLIVQKNGIVVKIPESPLILPSVTIVGICDILKDMGVQVEERNMKYGELIDLVKKDELAAICSIGTAGILNRAQRLLLINDQKETIAEYKADENHPMYRKLGEAKQYYWNIYKSEVEAPAGIKVNRYEIPLN